MFDVSKIIILMMIVACFAFSIRVTEFVTGVSDLSLTVFAATKQDKDDHDSREKPDEKESTHEDKEEIHAEKDDVSVEKPRGAQPKWRDANDSDLGVANVRMEMFADLSKRRKQIEQAERDMQNKAALLKAAEKELDLKFTELAALRKEIEELLGKQSEAEKSRVTRLVKIYEGMKPKEAARIFDTLDIDVLVSVISEMSERKVAPVLAAMNPERARTVTIIMAERKTLPEL